MIPSRLRPHQWPEGADRLWKPGGRGGLAGIGGGLFLSHARTTTVKCSIVRCAFLCNAADFSGALRHHEKAFDHDLFIGNVAHAGGDPSTRP